MFDKRRLLHDGMRTAMIENLTCNLRAAFKQQLHVDSADCAANFQPLASLQQSPKQLSPFNWFRQIKKAIGFRGPEIIVDDCHVTFENFKTIVGPQGSLPNLRSITLSLNNIEGLNDEKTSEMVDHALDACAEIKSFETRLHGLKRSVDLYQNALASMQVNGQKVLPDRLQLEDGVSL